MKRKTYSGLITKLNRNQIFVFGSNPSGLHGMGTARIAFFKYGAKWNIGSGLCGNSYALITKNLVPNFYDEISNITYKKVGFRSVSKLQIIDNIKKFYKKAREMKNHEFLVAYTAEGQNLSGYTSEELAEMFYKAKPIPNNVIFEDKFTKLIYKKI